ncbi:hypothetical protein BH10BDE1_BH10BDE1_11730 [soil metagenome]
MTGLKTLSTLGRHPDHFERCFGQKKTATVGVITLGYGFSGPTLSQYWLRGFRLVAALLGGGPTFMT